ncbi:hypothetical protein LZ32DRAFT_607627 [Colletotrichum eremochloae]|nr:hypothetical protein LZ32DRAFT_607627 [Colletotrichum eremochloae]
MHVIGWPLPHLPRPRHDHGPWESADEITAATYGIGIFVSPKLLQNPKGREGYQYIPLGGSQSFHPTPPFAAAQYNQSRFGKRGVHGPRNTFPSGLPAYPPRGIKGRLNLELIIATTASLGLRQKRVASNAATQCLLVRHHLHRVLCKVIHRLIA